jgi:hypothetical protein
MTLCALLGTFAQAQQEMNLNMLSRQQIVERVAGSVALILTGEGGGRLQSIGSGIIVRENGVLLTTYHLIKDAREVQVKLKNGEVYDQVALLDFDERRDVAALRIAAKGLPVLPMENADVGLRVYVVSNPAGLAWTAADGLLSAIRLADEVSGAGTGYKLLQFSAPASHGSSGGLLVDMQGQMLGIIVGSKSGQNLNFAVPMASVAGLADATTGTMLGSGKHLRLPAPEAPPSSAALANTDAGERMRSMKTIHIRSNTTFFEPEQLQHELQKRPEFVAWKIHIVGDERVADALIVIDRPLFTFIHTFSLTDKKTSIILASGKLTAWDGNAAAPRLAKEIIKRIKASRPVPTETANEKKAASAK